MFDLEVIKKEIIRIRQAEATRISKMKVVGERLLVPCRDCKIEVYFYKSSRKGLSPVLFDIHGGGHVLGDAAAQDKFCDRIRNELNIHVITINYRLAPEHPFPAATNDVYDVVKYFSDNAEKYNIDKNNIAIGGSSAGGNLATVTAMRAKMTGDFKLKCQILNYPFLDAATDPFSKPQFKGAIPPVMCLAFNEMYSKPGERTNPYVSPVYASIEELKGLPPAVVLTAELDSLCAEGEQYASKLVQAGVPVFSRRFLGAVHGFIEYGVDKNILDMLPAEMTANFPPNIPELAEEAIKLITGMLRFFFQEC